MRKIFYLCRVVYRVAASEQPRKILVYLYKPFAVGTATPKAKGFFIPFFMERKLYQEFTMANILAIEVIHNGMKGGDTGHGGFVNIKITNESCTDLRIDDRNVEVVQFSVHGDHERETLIQALKAAVIELETNKYF